MQHLICSPWWPCSRYQPDKAEVVILSHSDTLSHRFPLDCCSAVSVKNIPGNYSWTHLYFILHIIHVASIHCNIYLKHDKTFACMACLSKENQLNHTTGNVNYATTLAWWHHFQVVSIQNVTVSECHKPQALSSPLISKKPEGKWTWKLPSLYSLKLASFRLSLSLGLLPLPLSLPLMKVTHVPRGHTPGRQVHSAGNAFLDGLKNTLLSGSAKLATEPLSGGRIVQ